MAQTIRVTWRPEDFTEAADRIAFASYRLNEIQINPMMPYKTQEQLEHAFFHELVHFILWFSGPSYKGTKEYMHQDEDFVDLTAHLLQQALATMEYEDDPAKS